MTDTGSPHRLLRWGLSLAGLLVVATLGFLAWQSFYPVSAATGWSVQTVHRNVPKAASLMPMPDGSLMISQELNDAKGSIVRIHPDGQRDVVVGNLSKPDGMFATHGGWVFSQETGNAPVSFLKDGVVSELFRGENVQGLWVEGDDLYAIEDRKDNGRLLRYRWGDQSLTVIRDKLHEGESITRCTDGRMLYTEKKKGVVRELTDDGSDPVVLSGLNKPTFLMCDERGLWVNEDSTHRARLLLIDKQGQQQTILSFLKAPQSIVPTNRGTYLLAEGGRNRVLELMPATRTP
ncbi:UNVERIFIED_ORG: glucose/arabinose dehydrogenase [Pseudomonas fluorescens]